MQTVTSGLGLAVLAVTGLLSACNDRNCAPCEELATDDVRAFSIDTLTSAGFRRADLRSAYVVRYANRDLTGAADTIRQGAYPGRELLNFYGRGFGLRQLPLPGPAPGVGGYAVVFDFEAYSYRIVVPAAGRQFAISAVEVTSDLGKGSCACPRNTRRRFVLNGRYVTADGPAGTVTYLSR